MSFTMAIAGAGDGAARIGRRLDGAEVTFDDRALRLLRAGFAA
ncbi:hypothetical protein ACFPIJ_08275 [Dactylosporangium cerinum]|uniref:Uncharacterized protein n=1 Tax=Dactylosporangium cerinum TaxID=1434730 RepID=A0ABV9VN77_9ACTN